MYYEADYVRPSNHRTFVKSPYLIVIFILESLFCIMLE